MTNVVFVGYTSSFNVVGYGPPRLVNRRDMILLVHSVFSVAKKLPDTWRLSYRSHAGGAQTRQYVMVFQQLLVSCHRCTGCRGRYDG